MNQSACRRLIRAMIPAALLTVLFAARVVVTFESYRVKLVRDTEVTPIAGAVHVSVPPQPTEALAGPVAIIARVRNAAPTPVTLRVGVDGGTVCARTVSLRGPHRID